MDSAPLERSSGRHLDQAALDRIALALADSYDALYEASPVDPRVSLTGDMLAFVFEDGLSPADKALLGRGQVDRLTQFRRNFFEVVDAELAGLVADLTGVPVSSSFYGFDPGRRTTRGIFILDLGSARGAEGRQAVINWSEQVRRNARRLRQEHRDLVASYEPLKRAWRAAREDVGGGGAGGEGRNSGDR
jgi:hypothetical protein